jgi:TRAP-type mannitol/chloroaromatic compound transport system permease small subunit
LKIPDHDKDKLDEISDRINDAYGFFYALSCFVSPVIGARMFEKLGRVKTADTMVIANLLFAMLLFLGNPYTFEDEKEFKDNLNMLKQNSKQKYISPFKVAESLE